jgi:hypothetical protein
MIDDDDNRLKSDSKLGTAEVLVDCRKHLGSTP